MSLAILDGGTFYHHAAIHGRRYRELFDKTIYAPELTTDALAGVTFLIVPDRINPNVLRANRDVLIRFAKAGHTLVVFGENRADTWLPGVTWTARPTNFWWWLDKNVRPPNRLLAGGAIRKHGMALSRRVDPACRGSGADRRAGRS